MVPERAFVKLGFDHTSAGSFLPKEEVKVK